MSDLESVLKDAGEHMRRQQERIEQLEAQIKEVEAAHLISCKDSVSNMEDIENQERRIEQLEAELHSCFHRIEELQSALRKIVQQIKQYDLPAPVVTLLVMQKAEKALEGKKDD